MKLLRSDGVHGAASNAVRSLGRLGATLIVARAEGVETLGMLTAMIAAETIAICSLGALVASPAAVLAPGRRRTARRLIHAEAESLQAWIGACLAFVALVSATAFGVSWITSLALSAAILFGSVYQARRSTQLAEFRSSRVLVAEATIAAIGIAGPFLAIQGGLGGLIGFWSAQAVGHAAAFAVVKGTQRERRSAWSRGVARRSLLSLGRSMLTGSIANSVGNRMQPFAIASTLGGTAVGLYGAASLFGAPLRMLSGALRGVLLPRFAKRSKEGNIGRVSTSTVGGIVILLIASVWVSSLVAPLAVSLAFGPEFRDSSNIVPLCVLLAEFALLSSIVACARQASGQSSWVARIRTVSAIGSPLLLVAGLLLGGLFWGVAASVASEALCLLIFIKGPARLSSFSPRSVRWLSLRRSSARTAC